MKQSLLPLNALDRDREHYLNSMIGRFIVKLRVRILQESSGQLRLTIGPPIAEFGRLKDQVRLGPLLLICSSLTTTLHVPPARVLFGTRAGKLALS